MRKIKLTKYFISLLTLVICLFTAIPVFAAEKSAYLTFPSNDTNITNPQLNYKDFSVDYKIPISFKTKGSTQDHYVMYVTEVDANGKFIKPMHMYMIPIFASDFYKERTVYISSKRFVLDHYYKVEIYSINNGHLDNRQAYGYFQF